MCLCRLRNAEPGGIMVCAEMRFSFGRVCNALHTELIEEEDRFCFLFFGKEDFLPKSASD